MRKVVQTGENAGLTTCSTLSYSLLVIFEVLKLKSFIIHNGLELKLALLLENRIQKTE